MVTSGTMVASNHIPNWFNYDSFDDWLKDWVLAAPDPVHVAPLADEFLQQAEAQDVQGLRDWLWDQRHNIVALAMRYHLRLERRQAMRAEQPNARFGRAAAKAKDGDMSDVADFLDARIHVGSRFLRLGAMNGVQLTAAAGEYNRRAVSNAFESAFLAALAKRVGDDKTVGDVFTNDQLTKMRERMRPKDD